MPKIYTKKGDKGSTSLIGGKKISKDSLIFELLGTLDELSSSLGIVLAFSKEKKALKIMGSRCSNLQKDLMYLSSLLAFFKTTKKRPKWLDSKTLRLEKEIDTIEKELPKLKNFILPGATLCSAQLHQSRAVCRKLERCSVTYTNSLEESWEGSNSLLRYLNRLSDYLFILARYSSHLEGIEDPIWKT